MPLLVGHLALNFTFSNLWTMCVAAPRSNVAHAHPIGSYTDRICPPDRSEGSDRVSVSNFAY